MTGLRQPRKSPEGEWVDTDTMLTLNPVDHDPMTHMYRPGPQRPPQMQDKRLVVIVPGGLYEAGLHAPAPESRDFIGQYPADHLLATRAPLSPKKRDTATLS